MSAVFADTFFFVARLSPADEYHPVATKLAGELATRLVTSEWILMEIADGLAHHTMRAGFGKLLDFLLSNPLVTIVPADAVLFQKAIELYRSRGDKDWSLTDCTSFVIMTEREIAEALTGDHHFAQAGFLPLLK